MATSYVIVIAGTLDPAIHLLTKSCEEDGRAGQAPRVTVWRFTRSTGPTYGRTGSHRRSRPHGPDACHRPRPARGARAGDRAEGCPPVPTEDGALQRAHHGHRGGGSCRRAARALPDGHLRRVVAGGAGPGAPRASVRGGGKGADRKIRGRQPAARALSAHLAIHARAAAEIDRGDVAERHCAL